MNEDKKHIIVAVTGSIAAYRACELVRELIKKEKTVSVCMTANAARFVGPLTFQALTNRRVYVGSSGEEMDHIEIKNMASVFCVVPATANIIGKMACGIADDIVSSSYLAMNCPVIVAPAMNPQMYSSRAVRRNIDILRGDGVTVIEPGEGTVICGDTGQGKLADIKIIEEQILKISGGS